MLNQIMRFVKEEDGATAVEYGLMVSLIAVVVIASVAAIGTALNTKFLAVGTAISTGTAS
jgi:pilus assembly protein Flp/PilA